MSEQQQHQWKKIKGLRWHVCSRCDLMALNNEATNKRIKKPCVGQYIKVDMPEFMKQKM